MGLVVKTGGYSFVELVVVLALMSALAAIAVPRLQFVAVERKQAQATAETLVSSLRRTRSLALREAVSAPQGFSLTLESSTPPTAYAIKNVATGRVVDRHTLAEPTRIEDLNGTSFWFGPYGNLQEGSATHLRIHSGSWNTRITVTAATGMVTRTSDRVH